MIALHALSLVTTMLLCSIVILVPYFKPSIQPYDTTRWIVVITMVILSLASPVFGLTREAERGRKGKST